MESTAPDQHVQTMQANWDKGDVSMREENGTVGIVSVPAEAINNPWSSDGTATTPIHSTASEVGTVSNNAWREENHNEDGDDETGADDDGEKSSEPDLVFATEENESIARDMWGNPTRFKPVPILATSASDSTPSLAASRQSARVFWKKFSGKFMPQQAIPIGRDGDGAPLFSTRVVYKDGLQVGKGRNQAGCYLSYEGKEILLAEDVEYEVLCGDAEGIEWIPSSGKLSNSLISSDRLIQGGRESNGDQLFVGLCDTYFHGSQVGKCGQHLSGLHYPYDGKETIVSQYRVAAYGQILEMDDVALSLCEDVESINEQGTLSSVHWRTYSSSMPDAIRLGRDTDGTPLYAGRSKVKKGGVQVGKIRGDTCFIPFVS
ncbi:hypothetical protein BC830DRAFT_1165608 [Chytriomyces sp. MP71]|nr:hypothetical protein BC830DRAFT_1165608 [Chytriomyces sp. MP71]